MTDADNASDPELARWTRSTVYADMWVDPDDDSEWLGSVADPAVVDDAWRAWRAEVAFAEQFVADSAELGIEDTMQDGSGTIDFYACVSGQPPSPGQ